MVLGRGEKAKWAQSHQVPGFRFAATGSCPALLATLMSPALPFSARGSCERRLIIFPPAANRFYMIILLADSNRQWRPAVTWEDVKAFLFNCLDTHFLKY